MSEQVKSGRGLKIALAMSLALNLAVAGLVLGAMIGFGPRADRDDPRLRALGLGPFAIALSREDRAGFAARIDRESLGAERRSLGMGLRQLGEALRADPFDRTAAEAALARMRAATATLQGVSHTALLDQIAQMPPAERAVLADRLGRALRRMGGHRDAR